MGKHLNLSQRIIIESNLNENNSLRKIGEIMGKREPNYIKANFIIETDNKTPEEISREILGVIKC